ncbi:MAG: phosphopentomutase [Candidatus Wallbacteria bacterium HGW-Wallbacteria-1]|uniref:Phosphopentomutase n=1 Tax=Candidatus Wallbacteria bacterium HGW-Wallbacteria-1 TaxID=2013854 RepID=A0A2N1PJX2_9BACT|nr:MAG: phosphopentomutase [Candidatus Wallbacteria bacterium HGW-Wallbacteria-1]
MSKWNREKGRVAIVVLDSVGAGQMHDAAAYGDEGANTLGNISQKTGLPLPELGKLGLGNILFIKGTPPMAEPKGAWGLMAEASQGKDTTTGHWEIAGLVLPGPFPTYTDTGFPKDVRDKFESLIGRECIWKATYSGTELLKDFGEEHLKTGKPIVYTSADSVFQVAAHEEHFTIDCAKGSLKGIDALYEACRIARDEVLNGEHAVGRVIARPFVGTCSADFKRTANRHDYALNPIGPTILSRLYKAGFDTIGVGKIKDIFAGDGISEYTYNKGMKSLAPSISGKMSEVERTDPAGIENTLSYLKKDFNGLLFVNLVDCDMLFGHRNDVAGYRENLIRFDTELPSILKLLREDDILIITADHGCDPTYPGTDHSREFVPLLVYGQKVKAGVQLGVRKSFADIAATIAELFGVEGTGHGESFASVILD